MKEKEKDALGIKGWSLDDQPRFKLRDNGPETLSNSELLALLIGSGSSEESAVDLSRRILTKVGQDLDQLARMSISELMDFKGIGEAKAITVAAALELSRRRLYQDPKSRPKIVSSKGAYDVIAPLITDKVHEEFWVIFLDRSNRVLNSHCVSQGGVTSTHVDPKIIFRQALDHLASGMVLCHNHPSGQLQPSQQDLAITKKLQDAAMLFEIKILDHIILGGRDYYSFADEGIL